MLTRPNKIYRCGDRRFVTKSGPGVPTPSPDSHTIRWRQVKLLPGLNLKRLIPRIQIAGCVRTVLGRRVLVGQHLLAQGRLPGLASFALSIGDEKLLVSRESVPHRRSLVAQRSVVAIIGGGKARD